MAASVLRICTYTTPMKLAEEPVGPRARGRDDPRRLLLAADVGGTRARIGLIAARPSGRWPVDLLTYRSYDCAAWPGFAEILGDFIANHCDGRAVDECALAAAGYLRGDELVAENLRWPVRLSTLRAQANLQRLDVLNDFEALACATQFLSANDAFTLIEGHAERAPALVVGPGTGLGCALLLPGSDGATVLATEAGHVALAAGDERECEVLRVLARGRDYVPTGHALSGPGIVNLYRALAEIDGLLATHVLPAQISTAALRGDDALATEALRMFCAMLGAFVGDLAVLCKAGGGIWLAGGILPSIREFLVASDFRARFFNKGVMREFLSRVPVRLIEHGQLGVIGAACLHLRARREAA